MKITNFLQYWIYIDNQSKQTLGWFEGERMDPLSSISNLLAF